MHLNSVIQSRAFRVFVSSTFQDMGGERDYLVRVVFPQIRARAWQQAVAFQEIDLRWGITADEARRGEVLSICLEEIDRSQPFFIALLGARYGWVDPDAARDLPAHLAGFAGRSITELEIRHAAWCARDRPEPAGIVYVQADAVGSAPPEQAALVDELPQLGFTCRTYTTPEDLGMQVLRDLKARLQETWPGDAPTHEDAVRRHMARLQHGYVRRPTFEKNVQQALRRYRRVVLFGPAGAGKSALLAQIATTGPEPSLRTRLGLKSARGPAAFATGDVLTRGATWRDLVASIVDEPSSSLPGDRPEPDLAVALARRVGSGGGSLVLDGLDRLWDGITDPDLSWLDVPVPAHVSICLATARRDVAEALGREGWHIVTAPSLTASEGRAIADRYLDGYGKRLEAGDRDRLCAAPAAASPFALALMLNDLRVLSQFERLSETLAQLGATDDPFSLCCAFLRRLRGQLTGTDGRAFDLGLPALALSRAGMAEADLLAYLGRDGAPLAYAHWQPVSAGLEEFLATRDGRLEFTSADMRAAVLEVCVPTDGERQTVRDALAAQAVTSPDRRRAAFEVPFQTALAGRLDLLDAFLADGENRSALQRLNPDEARRFAGILAQHGCPAALASARRDAVDGSIDVALSAAHMLRDMGDVEAAEAGFLRLGSDGAAEGQLRVAAVLNAAELARRRGGYDAARAMLAQASGLAQAASDQADIQIRHATLALETNAQAELEGALDQLRKASLGDAQACMVQQMEAQLALRRGELADARAHAKSAHAAALRVPAYGQAAAASLVLSQIARRQNRDAEALRHLEEAERVFRRIGDLEGAMACLHGRCVLAIRAGDYDAALALAETQSMADPEASDLTAIQRVLRAEIMRRMGAVAAATRDLQALEAEMEAIPPHLAAQLRRKMAEIATDLRTE